jgi:hypothetical protein
MKTEATSVTLLRHYYPHVSRLVDYVHVMLGLPYESGVHDSKIIKDSDSVAYKNFVLNSLVACSLDNASPTVHNLIMDEPVVTMRDVRPQY